MKYTASVNGKLIQMFVGGHADDADEIDWALMVAARSLASVNKMFDPSMIAATVGKLVHARACELPTDSFMVLDISEKKIIDGPFHPFNEETASVVPNHTHVVIGRIFDGYVVTLCKGRDVNSLLGDGNVVNVGTPDPSYLG